MTAQQRQHAEGVIKRLKAAQASSSNGRISKSTLEWACRQTGRSKKTIYDWLKTGVPRNQRPKHHITNEIKVLLRNSTIRDAYLTATARGLFAGSEVTFYRAFNRDVPAHERAWLQKGSPGFEAVRQRVPHIVPARNGSWALDAHQVPVLVIAPDGNVVKPWLIGIEDQFSRLICSAVFATHSPTAYEAMLAFGEGMWSGIVDYTPVHGIPESLRHDNGSIFTADAFVDMAEYFGTLPNPTFPYSPATNGKIENWFFRFDTEFCSKLPAYTEGPKNPDGTPEIHPDTPLYSFEELAERSYEWIRHYNFKRPHSGIEGRIPADVWKADTTGIREADEAALRRCTLVPVDRVAGRRKVGPSGVVYKKTYYQHADLDDFITQFVEVRWRPGSRQTVYIFNWDTKEFICEAPIAKNMSAEHRQAVYGQVASNRAKCRGLGRRAQEHDLEAWKNDQASRFSPIARPGDVAEPVAETIKATVLPPENPLLPTVGPIGAPVDIDRRNSRLNKKKKAANSKAARQKPKKAGSSR
jgi:transposase InsO family protein